MDEYAYVVIGFGKAGKTLAGKLATAGKKVALVEKSPLMYGGTCINAACIPSKSLEYSARLSFEAGGNFEDKAERYRSAVQKKSALTSMLRKKNYDKLKASGAEVIDGEASFESARVIKITSADKTERLITGEKIIIDTGSSPFMPPVEGLSSSARVYDSRTLMDCGKLPEKLIIIGSGYIGLEFASVYRAFGSEVTVISDAVKFMPKEDEEIAAAAEADFKKRGIDIVFGAKILSVKDEKNTTTVTYSKGGAEMRAEADAVLVATGRRPETAKLNLGAAGVKTDAYGAIITDERLKTTAANIYAAGDVKGGMQFTYISLDDARIIYDALEGDGTRTKGNRGNVPYSVFIDPPLSRVGLTEKEAEALGYKIIVAKLQAGAVPKSHILDRPAGLMKAVIDAENGLILGAHLYCMASHELINAVKLVMDAKIPYTVLGNAIYTHPTMFEAFNDLFAKR